ncbi:hypothetical protein [Sporosarcina sp. Te-1]|uniref:hypothetical protein n=1 Tax=Sporosarcina sp. Te-1 TaxID=2818390 RepID=UPI001A9CD1F9|nr:hypothetical protein [Sporosarcina sp. Te-1]QTD41703.1 hypothetical protein J3U78_02275 [Sporosarcina sp. Te-1]
MNDKGYSWPEALLVLLLTSVIFGTLLPFATKMAMDLAQKKQAMFAARTAYQGVILHSTYGTVSGVEDVEETQFGWMIQGMSVCVSYTSFEKDIRTCYGI